MWHWVGTNHFFNSSLWSEEDLARSDATERVDEILLTELSVVDAASPQTDAPVSQVPAGARLNSGTAGSSSQFNPDRPLHQRADLSQCLDALIADTQAGRAYLKVYRQFKMYNDPRFNPALVAEQAKAKA